MGADPLRISPGLEALKQVEALRPHLNWIAAQAPAAILRGRAPRASVRAVRLIGRSSTSRLSSSTSRLEPVPSPWWRKLTAPAPAPSTSASASSRPEARAAEIAPIIVSPQPSREPASSFGGTSSQASSPSKTSAGIARSRHQHVPGPQLPQLLGRAE